MGVCNPWLFVGGTSRNDLGVLSRYVPSGVCSSYGAGVTGIGVSIAQADDRFDDGDH